MDSLPAHRKVIAMGLRDRGAHRSLVYFWYNLIEGNYANHSPETVIRMVEHYKGEYPEFADEIERWFESFKVVYARGHYLTLQ